MGGWGATMLAEEERKEKDEKERGVFEQGQRACRCKTIYERAK